MARVWLLRKAVASTRCHLLNLTRAFLQGLSQPTPEATAKLASMPELRISELDIGPRHLLGTFKMTTYSC
jgi:hypothetical protein